MIRSKESKKKAKRGGSGRNQGNRRSSKNLAASAAIEHIKGFPPTPPEAPVRLAEREAATLVALTERYGLEMPPPDSDAPLADLWMRIGVNRSWVESLLAHAQDDAIAPVAKRTRAILEDRRKYAKAPAVRPAKAAPLKCFRCDQPVDDGRSGFVLPRVHRFGVSDRLVYCLKHEDDLRKRFLGRPALELEASSEGVLRCFPGESGLGESAVLKSWELRFVRPSDGERVPRPQADVLPGLEVDEGAAVLPALEARRVVEVEGVGPVSVRAWVSVLPAPGVSPLRAPGLDVLKIEGAMRACEALVHWVAARERFGHFSTPLPQRPPPAPPAPLFLEARWIRWSLAPMPVASS